MIQMPPADSRHRPDDAPQTVDALRQDIDQSRAADKVDFEDPAASPLGTDAEASGNPPRTPELEMEKGQIEKDHPPAEHGPNTTISPAIVYGAIGAAIVLIIGWLATAV